MNIESEQAEPVIYYLAMNSVQALMDSPVSNGLEVREAELKNYRLNRFLYAYVGEPWQWTDKLSHSDESWKNYAESEQVRTWLAYFKGSIAGYFELKQLDDGVVDIAYFGLASDFIGMGFGAYLLSQAIQCAWAIEGTQQVTVNTCSLDHPNALENYRKRGFQVVDIQPMS